MTTGFSFDPADDFKLWCSPRRRTAPSPRRSSSTPPARTRNRPDSVAIGDVNGDDRPDVVVGLDRHGRSGGFRRSRRRARRAVTPTPDGARDPAGTPRQDGRLDVAASAGAPTPSRLPRDGTGGSRAPATYDAPHDGYDDLEVGDVTGDGRDDVVVMSATARTQLNVLAQHVTGTLGPRPFRDRRRRAEPWHRHWPCLGRRPERRPRRRRRQPAVVRSRARPVRGRHAAPPVGLGSYDVPEPRRHGRPRPRRPRRRGHGPRRLERRGFYRQPPAAPRGRSCYRGPYANHYGPQGLAIGDLNGDDRARPRARRLQQRPDRPQELPARDRPTAPGAPTLAAGHRRQRAGDARLDGARSPTVAPRSRATTSTARPLAALASGARSRRSAPCPAIPTRRPPTGPSTRTRSAPSMRSAKARTPMSSTGGRGQDPDAPTLTSATPGNTTVTLTWDPPFDGGQPISRFHATASPGGAMCHTGVLGCTIRA